MCRALRISGRLRKRAVPRLALSPADAANSVLTGVRGDRGWFTDNGQRATPYRVLGFGPQDRTTLASVRTALLDADRAIAK